MPRAGVSSIPAQYSDRQTLAAEGLPVTDQRAGRTIRTARPGPPATTQSLREEMAMRVALQRCKAYPEDLVCEMSDLAENGNQTNDDLLVNAETKNAGCTLAPSQRYNQFAIVMEVLRRFGTRYPGLALADPCPILWLHLPTPDTDDREVTSQQLKFAGETLDLCKSGWLGRENSEDAGLDKATMRSVGQSPILATTTLLS